MIGKILGLATGAVLLAGCGTVTAHREPARFTRIPASEFHEVTVVTPTPTVVPEIIYEPITVEIPTSRPVVKQPAPKATVVKPKPRTATKNVFVAPTSEVKKYALSRVGEKQFACLDNLWTKESNWNYKAHNKSSGAYGIPQALPGSKMASAGDDWETNPITQVKWGIRYVNGRYGSPCGAWEFWKSHHWY